MSIRVLQLGSPMGLYGAERWILALVRHLDRAKVESIVAAVKDEPRLEVPLCREASGMGFETHVLKAYGRVNISAPFRLRRLIRARRIQILHTHGYKQDLFGLLATRGTRCKLVSTPHGWSKQADLKLSFYEILDRAIFPFFDAVAPLSEDLLKPLRRIPGLSGKLRLIRNAVDILEIGTECEIAPELLKWKRDGKFVIGYIGQLIPRKGLDVLLRALRKLNGACWRVAIVGDGEEIETLQALAHELGISDFTRFFGFRKDRLSFLKAFDVFVLPSRFEGIPRCIMEAMTAGIPVIASDIPGCRDLVKKDETGILFPADDVIALASALDGLAANTGMRVRLGESGKKLVQEQFSAERMAREYEALYVSLVR